MTEAWLTDLNDDELADLYEQVLTELYVRAHHRSHEPQTAKEEAA